MNQSSKRVQPSAKPPRRPNPAPTAATRPSPAPLPQFLTITIGSLLLLVCIPLSAALLGILGARAQRAGPSYDPRASAEREDAWRAAQRGARERCAARCGPGSTHRVQAVVALRIIEARRGVRGRAGARGARGAACRRFGEPCWGSCSARVP